MVNFTGNVISINNRSFQLEYPIRDAIEVRDEVIVLFHPNAGKKHPLPQFPNLIALTPEGERKWTAELPTNNTGDRYYKIKSRNPIVVNSVYSWECEIDEATGRIARKSQR